MATSDRGYILLGFRIIADFGASIAVPVVVCALLGKWLDQRWGTRPFMLIAGFLVAAGLSALMIRKKAVAYGKEYQALIDKEQKKT